MLVLVLTMVQQLDLEQAMMSPNSGAATRTMKIVVVEGVVGAAEVWRKEYARGAT